MAKTKVKVGATGETTRRKPVAVPQEVAALPVLVDAEEDTQHYAAANTGRFTFRSPGPKPQKLNDGSVALIHDEGYFLDFGENGNFRTPIDEATAADIEAVREGTFQPEGGTTAKTLQGLAIRDQLRVIYPGAPRRPLETWDSLKEEIVVETAVNAGLLPDADSTDEDAIKRVRNAAKYEAQRDPAIGGARVRVLNDLQRLYDALAGVVGSEARYDEGALEL